MPDGHGLVPAQVAGPCPTCNGTGKIIKDPCKPCGGTGRVRTTEEVSVQIPEGMSEGVRLRVPNKGEPGVKGAPAGGETIFTKAALTELATLYDAIMSMEVVDANRTFTYLSVSEPFGFYLDGIAAAFCLVLGITVAYELIRGRPWEDTYETHESDRRPFSTAEALFAMH